MRGAMTVSRRSGSSPLARGLPGRPTYTIRIIGIIPARAGFTESCGSGVHYAEDHPRSRGVYDSSALPTATAAGSSPLARGLLVNNVGNGGTDRIIPARAGFTYPHARIIVIPVDHPRSRGVYAACDLDAVGL